MSAIVCNCNFNGLAIIRSLGRHGVKVLALDSMRSVGTFSRYARFVRCPDPAISETSFIEHLLAIGPRLEQRTVIFPTNDTWAQAIARHSVALSPYYQLCCPSSEVVDLLLDKLAFYRALKTDSVHLPRTYGSDEIDHLPPSAFPLILKPRQRRSATNTKDQNNREREADKARYLPIESLEDWQRFKQSEVHDPQQFIAQELIKGDCDCMATVGLYADPSSNALAIFTGQKERGFPPTHGNCLRGRSAELPEEVTETARRLCKKLGTTGIVEFEFKRDIENGRYYLIEINPRSWSWVGITPNCGIDLPWIAYSNLKNGTIPEEPHQIYGVRWIRLIEDWRASLWRYQHSSRPDWNQSFKEWRRDHTTASLVTAEYAADDPLPLLAESARCLIGCLKKG